jgi:hypothetical protein
MVSKKPKLLSEPELKEAAPQPIERAEVWLPLALLAPPIVWSLSFGLSYGLVYPAQRWQTKAGIHLVLLLTALLCLASIGLGWKLLRAPQLTASSDSEQRERTRFLAICACALGAFFLLATLAQTVPVLLLSLEARS